MSKNASTADADTPVSIAEAKTLFEGFNSESALVLAVSGGPDSTALMVLAARWRAELPKGPELTVVTIDHGLRPESAREARAVKHLAHRLGLRHRTLRWSGPKPKTGLQEAARAMRYRLLAAAARGVGARHVLTAHTLDDQAETVLLRMARGSGMTGLAGMARATPLDGLTLVRPLLDVPKARLVATLAAVGIAFVEDPSNRDPRFARARLRALLPRLAAEGLDARRLAVLARRLRRADAALEIAVDAAARAVALAPWPAEGRIVFDAAAFAGLPEEVGLRLLGRAIAACGSEGPVRLGRIETLHEALRAACSAPKGGRLRRTLAGALVSLGAARILIERAPARRTKRVALTTPARSRRGPRRGR